MKTRLSQQEGFKAQLRAERDELQNRVVHLEQVCRDLHYQLQQVSDEAFQLANVDLQFVLTKDSTSSASRSPYRVQRQQPAPRGLFKEVASRSPSMERNRKMDPLFQGVPGFVQGIAQAKLIEKVLKLDQASKKEVKCFGKRIEVLEAASIQYHQSVKKLQDEKAALEQMILEILCFGEQCNKQFEQLQSGIKNFEQNDKSASAKQSQVLQRIKVALNEQTKNVIVKIEDTGTRDSFLQVLTKLNQHTLSIDFATSQIL